MATKEVILEVKGMHCAGCENNVKRILLSKGVLQVEASAKENKVKVIIDDSKTPKDSVISALKALKYEVAI